MSADRYMLELFSQEARSHSAALRGALAGSSEFADAAKAAGGLKGIARMLGFALLADVCAKLEGVFSKGGSEASNPEVAKCGRLGRSFGCPALPRALTRPIIDAIKGGSVLFIYAEKQDYLAQSSILQNHDIL